MKLNCNNYIQRVLCPLNRRLGVNGPPENEPSAWSRLTTHARSGVLYLTVTGPLLLLMRCGVSVWRTQDCSDVDVRDGVFWPSTSTYLLS